MAITRTKIEILNKDLEKVVELRNFYPLNEQGVIIRYSNEMSDYGQCIFRIPTKDSVFSEYGDFIKPHKYHVRVVRGREIVWQGAIIDNPERNKLYVEVVAAEYLFYLDRILIRRDSDKPATEGYDESNYKVFNSGTMASAVTTTINNAKSDFGSAHVLSGLTIGTIENPDYPNGFIDSNKKALTGAWSFSDDVAVQFDYHSVLYVLKSFGVYSGADFEITNSLQFNFKKLIGQRIKGISFVFGRVGANMVDYNLPRYGRRQVNHLLGIGADLDGVVLHDFEAGRNDSSIKEYGLLQEAKAFSDVKDKNNLGARVREEGSLMSEPEEGPVNVILNEKAYPIGQYGIGDVVWVEINDGVISYRKERRVVGITVNLHNTGREMVAIQTNKVPQKLLGAT